MATVSAEHGAQSGFPTHGHAADVETMGRAAGPLNARASNMGNRAHSSNASTTRRDPSASRDNYSNANGSRKERNEIEQDGYDDIPENMYRPEKHALDPRWIHRDKLAKIESEELQAAGINLANARSRSRSRLKSGRSVSSNETDNKRDEKRQRLQSPIPIDDEVDHDTEQSSWDLRLPEEIEEEAASTASASQMYANPMLRKSGSKIPVMTSSPLPIPAERYERDTPVPRKRTASGSISIEGDATYSRTKNLPSTRTATDESDKASSLVGSSTTNSPQKHSRQRSKSINLGSPPANGVRKSATTTRKISGPATTSTQRPSTRSGEQDKDKERNRLSFHAAPEGDPPWLATMYKPDPMLPPDQQLIPTLAKKQMQAQWAAEGALPKAYGPDFNPIDVQTPADKEKEVARQKRASQILSADMSEIKFLDSQPIDLQPMSSFRSNNNNNGNSARPGTSGSITAGYSTMPKVASPPLRQQSLKVDAPDGNTNTAGRSTALPPPARMQATSVVNEDDDAKKGCACCVIM